MFTQTYSRVAACVIIVAGGFFASGCQKKNLLTCPSFEECTPATNLPSRPGEWGADETVVVSGTNGVVPADGRKMLEFSKGFFDQPSGGISDTCQVILIPSTYMDAQGVRAGLIATASARFARSSESTETCEIGLAALAEMPPGGRDQSGYSSPLASSTAGALVVPADRRWHTLETSLPIPPGARYLCVSLGARRNSDGQFTGQFVDDVVLTIRPDR